MLLATSTLVLALSSPAATSAAVRCQGVGSSLTELSAAQASEHFSLRYRPGSRAGASVDRTAHYLELEYAQISEVLGLQGRVDEQTPFTIFLYDNVQELELVTKVGGTGGFSTARECHIPWDNDQTRKHELVHIVVAAMPSTGDEPRNMFFAEGISNAVLEFVHGVPVHAVAAYELGRGSLPPLEELLTTEDFYAYLGEHPGLNGYDVGGSFFRFLLETHEPREVMDYYHGRPIEEALGKPLSEIEQAWHERLAAFPLRPELELLLARRRGDGGEFTRRLSVEQRLPAELLGEPRDWTDLQAELAGVDELASWSFDAEAASADNPSPGDWSIAEVPDRLFGDCVLRVKVRTGDACWGVQLRHGGGCQAMLLGQGAFIYTERGGIAHTPEERLVAESEIDLVLHVEDGEARVYLDGNLILEAHVELQAARIGIGVVGGSASFSGFSVREL